MTAIDDSSLKRVRAVHPHWSGHLLISIGEGRIIHEASGLGGCCEIHEDTINIRWDNFPAEVFCRVGCTWVKDGFKPQSFDAMSLVRVGSSVIEVDEVQVRVPRHAHTVKLRTGTTDGYVFEHVFVNEEYAAPSLPERAQLIIDLGANIGLSAAFFALRYPTARIFCVEADRSNFEVLTANVAAFGERVTSICAAAWCRNGWIGLRQASVTGRDLGAWGRQVADGTPVHDSSLVPSYTLDTLSVMAGDGQIDILKVDIEGAELEVFSCESRNWMDRVKLIVVETHDRFRSGTEVAVRDALRSRFDELPSRGENLFFARR